MAVVTRTLDFRPSINGFHFANSFRGPNFSVTVPVYGKINIGDASNGVCGGMVFGARDFFEAHQQVPSQTSPPADGDRLYAWINQRLIESFDVPTGIGRYLFWMAAPDRDSGILWWKRRGVGSLTVNDQWPTIRATLDSGHPCPLGLVTVAGLDPRQLGANHVVLAYGYSVDAATLTLEVYDPNSPGRDDIRISLPIGSPGRGAPITHNVDIPHPIRGFFALTYRRQDPIVE